MKLSMWMIANQVSELDVKLEISENAPAVLNSARLAYATNCVHIFRENDYVVCSGEGDRILFYDMDVTRVFELVQSIFDAYEDWISKIREEVACHDYQAVMDITYRMFKNPLVLTDANYKVLGMTKAYGAKDVDSEWEWLSQYGYSSVDAVNMIRFTSGSGEFISRDKVSYRFRKNSRIAMDGICCCIFFNDIICGRINLIAKERELNHGDSQLLQEVIDVLQPGMGQDYMKQLSVTMKDVFLTLCLDEDYDPATLEMQLKYQGWKEDDTFYVTVIRLEEEIPENLDRQMNVLTRLVFQNLTDISVNRWKDCCILISARELDKEPDSGLILRSLMHHNTVRIAFSLPDHEGIREISRYYRQALYALEQAVNTDAEKYFIYFKEYAFDYLLTAQVSVEDKLRACMPEAYLLWQDNKGRDDMFRTLKCYLDCERSVAQTSAQLHLHRNTTVYRLRKLQDNLNLDLDDPKVRGYCHLSLQFLESYRHMRDRS